MSSDVVLSVKNISKCFEMYEKPVHRLYQTLCAGHKKFYKEFWALKDINFEVRKGECVGIVGKNGAGKSTLLQIITGTLSPTTGNVQLSGRVAALLELGSGFNPEFTGRENVYMNASILGLSRGEIEAKFDEILEFADIGEFIDQPVKTYSSGMFVRLAFAVQVMVDPDVLIVDEALAVGDAAFQRKCYARMDALLQNGTTILLVTHDTETVKQRCDRCLFIKDHTIEFDGDSETGVVLYMKYLFPVETREIAEQGTKSQLPNGATGGENGQEAEFIYCKRDADSDTNQWGIGGGHIDAIRIYGLKAPNFLQVPGKIRIEVEARWDAEFARRKIAEESLYPSMMVGIRISDIKNLPIYGTNNIIEKINIDPSTGFCTVGYDLEFPQLKTGDYFLSPAISIGSMQNHIHLVWDDLSVQLRYESSNVSDGVFYCSTKIDVK